MICSHCGTEHALGADYVCRDALKAKLAIMTKRAEAAEAKIAKAVEVLQKAAPWADDNKVLGKAALIALRVLAAARKETP